QIHDMKLPNFVKAVAYVDDFVTILNEADLVVSRAGATTLSEIITLKIPTILIPSPYVPDNHQVKKASDLVMKKAAVMIEEKDLVGDVLIRQIQELIENEDKIEEMKAALEELDVPKSA